MENDILWYWHGQMRIWLGRTIYKYQPGSNLEENRITEHEQKSQNMNRITEHEQNRDLYIQ